MEGILACSYTVCVWCHGAVLLLLVLMCVVRVCARACVFVYTHAHTCPHPHIIYRLSSQSSDPYSRVRNIWWIMNLNFERKHCGNLLAKFHANLSYRPILEDSRSSLLKLRIFMQIWWDFYLLRPKRRLPSRAGLRAGELCCSKIKRTEVMNREQRLHHDESDGDDCCVSVGMDIRRMIK